MTQKTVTPDTYRRFVAGLFNRTGDLSKDFAHATMGVYTEAVELLCASGPLNEIEELGDLLFFSVAMTIVLDDYRGQTVPPRPEQALQASNSRRPEVGAQSAQQAVENAVFMFSTAADAAKRWVGYGKEPTEQACRDALLRAWELLMCSATLVAAKDPTHLVVSVPEERVQKALQDAAWVNIQKLQARYPGGFSLDNSVNRDVRKEAEVMHEAQSQ